MKMAAGRFSTVICCNAWVRSPLTAARTSQNIFQSGTVRSSLLQIHIFFFYLLFVSALYFSCIQRTTILPLIPINVLLIYLVNICYLLIFSINIFIIRQQKTRHWRAFSIHGHLLFFSVPVVVIHQMKIHFLSCIFSPSITDGFKNAPVGQ